MLLIASAFLLCAPLAVAQNNLGELLDTGGKLMSPEEFRQQLVQRMVVGLTPSGTNLEVMYISNGTIQGVGTHPLFTGLPLVPLSGEWKIDETGRMCSSMRWGGSQSQFLPSRCQFWFKYKEQYFLSDSDTDRGAKVLRRTVKQ